jgi:hypothetical protein
MGFVSLFARAAAAASAFRGAIRFGKKKKKKPRALHIAHAMLVVGLHGARCSSEGEWAMKHAYQAPFFLKIFFSRQQQIED